MGERLDVFFYPFDHENERLRGYAVVRFPGSSEDILYPPVTSEVGGLFRLAPLVYEYASVNRLIRKLRGDLEHLRNRIIQFVTNHYPEVSSIRVFSDMPEESPRARKPPYARAKARIVITKVESGVREKPKKTKPWWWIAGFGMKDEPPGFLRLLDLDWILQGSTLYFYPAEDAAYLHISTEEFYGAVKNAKGILEDLEGRKASMYAQLSMSLESPGVEELFAPVEMNAEGLVGYPARIGGGFVYHYDGGEKVIVARMHPSAEPPDPFDDLMTVRSYWMMRIS